MSNRFKDYVRDFMNSLTPSLIDNIRSERIHWLLYECFVYCVVANALRDVGIVPTAENIRGNRFRFRKRHGSATSDFSYLVLRKDGHVAGELHKSIMVDGRSGSDHELDIALVSIRFRNNVNPAYNHLLMYFECKCYGKPLDKAIAREYLGLVREMKEARTPNGIASNIKSPDLDESVQQILTAHGLSLHSVSPDSSSAFVGWLQDRAANMRF